VSTVKCQLSSVKCQDRWFLESDTVYFVREVSMILSKSLLHA